MNIDAEKINIYEKEVAIKFQLYNGLFTALPFHKIEKTGTLLAQFHSDCQEGYENSKSPTEIVTVFLQKHAADKNAEEKLDMLFRFTQYAERQVVLFDAIEDAAFSKIHDIKGAGSIKALLADAKDTRKEEVLAKRLEHFCIQLVLTAHPTQFYTGAVLGIINDTTNAVALNNVEQINSYLQQLGKTPFLKKTKPTPLDEAISLIWFLENVFYHAAGKILNEIIKSYPQVLTQKNPVLKLGFWPGGDRDGNPYVTAATTLRVGDALRSAILRSYYNDVRKLRRRLTFKGVELLIKELEAVLYNSVYVPQTHTVITKEALLHYLNQIKEILTREHDGLFLEKVERLISKIYVFGLHFATLDIRQEATVHEEVLQAIIEEGKPNTANYAALPEAEKISILQQMYAPVSPDKYKGLVKDTLLTIQAMRRIQKRNGEAGCNRYIISQCQTAVQVLEVVALFRLAGWNDTEMPVDIVPLFETVNDLQQAASVMEALYKHEGYATHLANRGNKQIIMLGFSDGTKDGGYLMANWGIYKAKEALTAVSRAYGINVVFFDGRGGPPARGGGKTHRFYASMGKNIANEEIQITVQGQTISSRFGTAPAARYNMEQLLSAGLRNNLFSESLTTMSPAGETVMQNLAQASLEKYVALKEMPSFIEYLLTASPIQYYGQTNIGSRPSKRKKGAFNLQHLRAIPYVSAWSQMKQNVPGFYGVGTAIQKLDQSGKLEELKSLYAQSLFVRTLFDNCEMAMLKCFFPLTQHLKNHPVFGQLWQLIQDEYILTSKYVLSLTGHKELMQHYPIEKQSIYMRDRIVLPLSTLQQYALSCLAEKTHPQETAMKKLVIRCSFGIINAARNSV